LFFLAHHIRQSGFAPGLAAALQASRPGNGRFRV
jgi:hypothetical protein